MVSLVDKRNEFCLVERLRLLALPAFEVIIEKPFHGSIILKSLLLLHCPRAGNDLMLLGVFLRAENDIVRIQQSLIVETHLLFICMELRSLESGAERLEEGYFFFGEPLHLTLQLFVVEEKALRADADLPLSELVMVGVVFVSGRL